MSDAIKRKKTTTWSGGMIMIVLPPVSKGGQKTPPFRLSPLCLRLRVWSWFQRIRPVKSGVTLLIALLAASAAKTRCTAVVCSCYAPSGIFNNKGEGSSKTSTFYKTRPFAEKRDGVGQNFRNHGLQDGSGNGSNGILVEFPNLKSNLKKKTKEEEEEKNFPTETRKVNWPDAHGQDIAHVQEFEPSVSGDGELEGVRKSCVCTIQ